jgi:hypothetical protein
METAVTSFYRSEDLESKQVYDLKAGLVGTAKDVGCSQMDRPLFSLDTLVPITMPSEEPSLPNLPYFEVT